MGSTPDRANSRRKLWLVAIVASIVVIGAIATIIFQSLYSSIGQMPEKQPGALVTLKMNGQVGVLLDEIPASIRDREVANLMAKPSTFWAERAKDQLRLMDYRMVFREGYYDESEGKKALPLPPEEVWNVQFTGAPHRATMNGHDLVIADYAFDSTLLTDINSPGNSEPALKSIGGEWTEHFVLPVDPELLFQRTDFACMNENQFPPHSVDAEEVDTFYDQEADIEDTLSIEGTHQAVMPETSCVDALDAKIGKIDADLVLTRVPWNSNLADKVRVGEITNPTGPDLIVEDSDFKVHRVVYRYIQSDSCAVAEGSVGGTGWRRLLQFGAADRNFGAKTLEIGNIDYFISGNDTELARQGIYEYSLCHNHYHFKHYGSFTFGDEAVNHKMGFCLQSTNRFSNNEHSPLTNVYAGCSFQGIEAGWVDEYKAGLENQWVDVTGVNTSTTAVTEKLAFHSNPDGFLCEGTPILDQKGNPTFEPTDFKTDHGQTVYRQECDYGKGTLDNNVHSYDVVLPTDGNGYVTDDCQRGEIGPLRNCGFSMLNSNNNSNVGLNCTPTKQVRLNVSIPAEAPPQIIRVCEYSSVLATSIPCTYNGPYNARSLANGIVEQSSEISFSCPAPLDDAEQGGRFSLYIAPVLPEDKRDPQVPVTVNIVES